MASGDHRGDKSVQRFQEHAQPSKLDKQTIWSARSSTMKEVDFCKKEETNKKRCLLKSAAARSPAGRTVHNSRRAKKVVSCKKKVHHVALCPGGHRRALLGSGGCRMANKENELSAAEDLQHGPYGAPYRHPLNLPETTKMEGPGSKYSDYFAELSKDHEAMVQVLFGRNLKLNVAMTLWRRNADELVAYLLRIQDTSVVVDCLPVITKSLQEEKPRVSIGCCVDLLPLVKTLLSSQYEEYLMAGLDWVQSVLRKWWPDLSVNGKTARDSCSDDRNIEVMKQQLQELWDSGSKLILVPGTTGEMAKAVDSYLSQLR